MSCEKCNRNQIKKWNDGVCTGCRSEPPTSEQMLALSFRRLNSINSHLTFYTVLVVINIIVILLVLFGVVDF